MDCSAKMRICTIPQLPTSNIPPFVPTIIIGEADCRNHHQKVAIEEFEINEV